MKTLLSLLIASPLLLAQDFYYEFGQKVEVKKKESSIEAKSNPDILEYEDKNGKSIKFKNEIVVVCENSSCLNDINNYNYETISKNFYLIKVQKAENIFEICQELYSKDSIKTATPNFVKTRQKR